MLTKCTVQEAKSHWVVLAVTVLTQCPDWQCSLQKYIKLNVLQHGASEPVSYSRTTEELFSK
jgi:hypothetical protein